jgi:hypothetical protein
MLRITKLDTLINKLAQTAAVLLPNKRLRPKALIKKIITSGLLETEIIKYKNSNCGSNKVYAYEGANLLEALYAPKASCDIPASCSYITVQASKVLMSCMVNGVLRQGLSLDITTELDSSLFQGSFKEISIHTKYLSLKVSEKGELSVNAKTDLGKSATGELLL